MDNNYLCFSTGEHYFVIENDKVIKILPQTKLYQLPLKERKIKGFLLVDQHLMALIDIEKFWPDDYSCKEEYYIVIEIDGEYLGICANRIFDNRLIDDRDWKCQDNNKFPLYYKEGEIKIYYLDIEMLMGE